MNIDVSLPNELAEFVEAQVSAGRYASTSDVIMEALRRMERIEQQQGAMLGSMRLAWQEGLASGDAGEIDITDLKRQARTYRNVAEP